MNIDLVTVWDWGIRDQRVGRADRKPSELAGLAGVEGYSELDPYSVQAYALRGALHGTYSDARRYARSNSDSEGMG